MNISNQINIGLLQRELGFLSNIEQRVFYVELRPQALRDSVAKITENINSLISQTTIPFEVLIRLKDVIEILSNAGNKRSLGEIFSAVVEMDYTVHTLREFVLHRHKTLPAREIINVDILITLAERHIREYAKVRRISISKSIRCQKPISVFVHKDEMVRAIVNVLHNAIKYSWTSQRENHDVKIYLNSSEQYAIITISNKGVPIPIEEIENGTVFRIATRGSSSVDRDRPGSGIGLFYAQKTILSHKGSITITSKFYLKDK